MNMNPPPKLRSIRPTPSSTHLRPPPAHHHQQHRSPSSSSTSSPLSAPRPPLTIHPTATVAESVVFQGTYQISIGAATVIHPRARMYSFEGPIIIGDGCIIGEKSVIGAGPGVGNSITSSASKPATATTTMTPFTFPAPPTQPHPLPPVNIDPSTPKTIRLSTAVSIAPLSSILPGTQIHSAATIDSLATIHRNADIGAHSKICPGCQVPENGVVGEWTVVWGAGAGFGQRRRKRAVGAMGVSPHVVVPQQQGQALKGKVVEDARLIVLSREREALARMIAVVPAGSGRR